MKNTKAEESILGAIFTKPDLIHSTTLEPDDFYIDNHRFIFQIMRKLQDHDKLIDEIGILDSLTVLDSDIEPFYLTSFREKIVSTSNFKEWCDIVKENSNIRKMNFLSYDIQKQIEAGKTIAELKNIALEGIEEIQSGNDTKIKSLNEVKDEMIQNKLDIIDGKISYIKTGYDIIDHKRGGFNIDYVLLAGRPSTGKTTFAVNWALNMAKNGVTVGFIPLESHSINLCERIVKQEIENFNFKDRTYLDGLKDYDLGNHFFIDDTFGENINEMEESMRILVTKYGCKVIFIDYLQLISGKEETRNLEISKISRRLVRFRKKHNISIVALSQLRRGDEGKEPELSDLRDSGSLEQDADIVVMLHCPPSEKENIVRSVKVSIKKYREGALDSVNMEFYADKSHFADTKRSYRTEF